MKSNNPIKPIYRVEYWNNETDELDTVSIFFENIEDAKENANCFKLLHCTAYIHKYWLK